MKSCLECLHAIPHPVIPSMCIKKHIMKKGSNDKCPHYAWQGDGTTYTVIENGKKVTRFKGQNDQLKEYDGVVAEDYVENLKKEVYNSPYLKKRPIRKFIRNLYFRFINLFRKDSR